MASAPAQSPVEFANDLQPARDALLAARTPAAFREAELLAHRLARGAADRLVEQTLQVVMADRQFRDDTVEALRKAQGFRHGGHRNVEVTLLGGRKVSFWLEYFKPDHRGRPGRKRTKRGKAGVGLYPQLAALGFVAGVSPALAVEICTQVADSDSLRSGRAALARRGMDLGHKQTLRIVNGSSTRAVAQRSRWLDEARRTTPRAGPLSGQRVVVATDGGRLRERLVDPRGRRRAATGHHRYDAPWREPKLLTIYVISSLGRVVRSFKPVYDGTLEDADAVFEMILGYLLALGGHLAKELIFVGDGARWIWDRVPQLIEKLGLNASVVTQVVDWCHAAQTLHEIADARLTWEPGAKEAWLSGAKRALHNGDTSIVLEHIDALGRGRNAKAVLEHRDYFDRNAARMQYSAFEDANLPTGSGAIESAIRRIINMRMKSNGMFWLERNAEGMLLLRSYLKAGHLDHLLDWSLTTTVPWWSPTGTTRPVTPLDLQAAEQ